MSQVLEELERYISEGTAELFDCYGAPVTRVGSSAPESTMDPRIVATIGFVTEDGTKGNIVLVTTHELVEAVQPAESGKNSDEAVCDVVGEISNMLLGRLKNSLLTRGVTLMLGTPTTAIVLKLWLASPFSPSGWLAFDVGGHQFHVRFAASFSDSFELADKVETTAPALAEGEMILF